MSTDYSQWWAAPELRIWRVRLEVDAGELDVFLEARSLAYAAELAELLPGRVLELALHAERKECPAGLENCTHCHGDHSG